MPQPIRFAYDRRATRASARVCQDGPENHMRTPSLRDNVRFAAGRLSRCPGAFGQRHQDIGIPDTIEAQRFIEAEIAAADIEAGRVYAQQSPRQRVLRACPIYRPHHDRRAARAAMGPRIGQEIAASLEP